LSELKWVSASGFEDYRTPLALLAMFIQAGRFNWQLDNLSVPCAEFEDEDLKRVLESMKLGKLDFIQDSIPLHGRF